jgi:hypothetical protein
MSDGEVERLFSNAGTVKEVPENPTDFIPSNMWPFFYSKLHYLSEI